MEKDFINWNDLKTTINNKGIHAIFKEREIWWCNVGVNIGNEIDGKNEKYNRPVLVIRKFNKKFFFGIPLTTKIKDNPYYFCFTHHDKKRCAMLSQARPFDSKRLHKKIGRMQGRDFLQIRNAMANIFFVRP